VAITDYTTYADIRAVLGVDETELEDTTIGLQTYENTLTLALSATSGVLAPSTQSRNLAEQYTYIDGLTSPTDDETKMKLTIEMFACYTVAAGLASSLSMFAPKTQSEGKALLTRFSGQNTYLTVQKNIWSILGQIKSDFSDLFGETVEDIPYVRVVEPATDLVTGSEA